MVTAEEARRNPLEQAFTGVVVVDFTTNIAGPYATMILADMGAQVIKVERPGRGDDTRHMSPVIEGNTSASFEAINRGKRSVALDLKDPDGRRQAAELCRNADVVIESFRPGVMDRLGLGFDDLSDLNPGLVYCSVSGFGHEVQGRDRGAYDPLIQAFTGLMAMTGEREGAPVRSGASISDVSTGMWAAMGVMSALRLPAAERPIHVQASLLDSVLAFLAPQVAATLTTGRNLPRMGSASPLMTPYQAFETRDGELMLAAGNDSLFRRVALAMDLPDLAADERFTTMPSRVRNMDELVAQLQVRFATRSNAEWLEAFGEHGVPCAPVNEVTDVLGDPLVADRSVLVQLGDEAVPVVALPLRASTVTIQPRSAAPTLGEFNGALTEAPGSLLSGADTNG